MILNRELSNLSYYKEIIKNYRDKGKCPPADFPLSSFLKDINSYKFSKPRNVKIPKSDGKSFRDIYVFNEADSFLLKVLNEIFVSNFSKDISDNVFSYIKGVRTFDAARFVQRKLRTSNLYCFKIDISNYFLSVDKYKLKECIDSLVEDAEGRLFMYELFNIFTDDYLGIMPGAAISSFFANYLLKPVDDFLASNSLLYARYSDDMILFSESREHLVDLVETLKSMLYDFGLSINPNKVAEMDCNNPIEFLGLLITKSEIDISKKTLNNIKSYVKRICKGIRKNYELGKIRGDSECACKVAVNRLNRGFYLTYYSNKVEHKGSRMSYVISNVTTTKSVKILDTFILNNLNYILTGNYNRSKKNKNYSFFKELGYRPIIKIWNLCRMNSSVAKNYLAVMNKPLITKKLPKPLECRFNDSLNLNVSSLFKLFSLNKLIYIVGDDGLIYSPAYLEFDFLNNEIKFLKKCIVKGNNFLIKTFRVCIDNTVYNLDTSSLAVCDFTELCDKTLINLYANSANDLDADYKFEVGYRRYNIFRYLYSGDMIEFDIDFESTRCKKNLLFYLYLHHFISLGTIDTSKSYFQISHNGIDFIFDFSLLRERIL